jgi:methylmalonyl-CoA mutase
MTKAIQTGLPKRRIEAAAATRQARLDAGQASVVGVNAYVVKEDAPLELRFVDNAAVRQAQCDRLSELKARRDAAKVAAALEALTRAAEGNAENLLALSIDAMRARATVGEVSEALARVYGRYEPKESLVGGVYGAKMANTPGFLEVRERAARFEKAHGRRPRLLVGKLGQDGHDRGAKVIAAGFADLGFDVDLAPLFQTPEEVARQALDNDVHVVGISTQAGAHLTLVPELVLELKKAGAKDVLVVCGGVIPPADHEKLEAAGVSAVFGPGTSVVDAAARTLELLDGRAHG